MALFGWLGGLGFLPLRRQCSGPAASLMQRVVVSALCEASLRRCCARVVMLCCLLGGHSEKREEQGASCAPSP